MKLSRLCAFVFALVTFVVPSGSLPAQTPNHPPSCASVNGYQPNWWKEAVVYQVYPRSFKDSNGDGKRK